MTASAGAEANYDDEDEKNEEDEEEEGLTRPRSNGRLRVSKLFTRSQGEDARPPVRPAGLECL